MTGNLPMTIINLFFVPMISMMICYRRKNKEYKFNAQFFMPYSIYCVSIPTITKIFLVLLKNKGGIDIGVDSSYYTAFAMVVAYVLPYLVEIWQKNISIKCSISVDEERKTNDKEK